MGIMYANSYSYRPATADFTATVLETRKPAEDWSDVLKVKFKGSVYSIGDTVHVDRIGYGLAKEFRPEYMIVSIFQGDGRYCGTTGPYKYSDIKYMSGPKADGSQQELDPNKAFKKKKGVF